MSSHLSDIQTTPVRGLDGCTAVISRVVWIESSCQINYRKFEFLTFEFIVLYSGNLILLLPSLYLS